MKTDRFVPEEERASVAEEERAATVPVAENGVKPTDRAVESESFPTGGDTSAETNASPVDFSDEEARLAASAPEFDLGEEQDEERADGPVADLGTLDRAGLLDRFARLLETVPVQSLRQEVEAIKVAYYKQQRAENEQLRRMFVESGGAVEDFVVPTDEMEARFKDLFNEYRRRRDSYLIELDRQKEENLRARQQVLEELRALADSNETLGHTFNMFRELQRRWKEIGPVPQPAVKDLWETYNLHVENFYNYVKINKELRDLDLRHNYDTKVRLCEEAERLLLEPSIVPAFRRLQELHDEWRETGPVALEYKEPLWERFREASTRINRQHQEHFEQLKEEQRRNLELKTELCVKAEELVGGTYASRREWNKASDRLIEMQKVWKTIGFAPKKDNTRIYERFRDACDRFFELKRKFYEQLRGQMDENLARKIALCEEAETLAESEQWKKAADRLIALQKSWKEIGPVPRRQSDAVWKRFRAACDRFFERKSAHFSEVDARNEENLRVKTALLEEIEAYDKTPVEYDDIREFQNRWSAIGFVPIRQKEAVQERYKAAMDRLFEALRGGRRERDMDRFRDRISGLRGAGDRRLGSERDRLYGRVKQLESTIATLENNIGFFARSKNAEAMIADVRAKIDRARAEMAEAIEKIKLIDKQE